VSLSDQFRHVSDLLPLVLDRWEEVSPLESRLSELERDRHQWEARIEAEMMRAESRFKQARSSEERTRTLATNAEALAGGAEGEDDVANEYLEFLRRNGEAGTAPELQSMPAPVAVDAKTRAIQAKFGAVI